MANYKSAVGVDQVYCALVTQDDQNAYAAGTPFYLAPVMTITNTPKVNIKTQFADNQPFDAMLAEGETEMQVELTNIQLTNLATLLGRVYDSVANRMYDNGGSAPFVAIGFRAKKSDGNYRYFWFLKCLFSTPVDEAATISDTPDPKSVKLKFTALRSIYQFVLSGSVTDSIKRVMADTADASVVSATWFGTVQVPAYGGPPALTATPTPANNATGQSTTVVITVAFSNALAGGYEQNISLADNGTKAAIAVTRTISGDRKTVTLAHSALTAAHTYLISVTGVKDIYGQTLADVVYNFGT
jgi:phi13 family phage major tail protein